MKTHSHIRPTSPRLSFFLSIALATILAGASGFAAQPGNGKGKGEGKGKGKGASADFVPPGHRRAPVEVIVTRAPPALRFEKAPERPSTLHVLVPGFWGWEATAYIWTPSIWILPPEPAAVWVAPRFERRASVSVFISGFWSM